MGGAEALLMALCSVPDPAILLPRMTSGPSLPLQQNVWGEQGEPAGEHCYLFFSIMAALSGSLGQLHPGEANSSV